MALFKCPECGKMISEDATVCVGCGKPIDDATRRHWIFMKTTPLYTDPKVARAFEEVDRFLKYCDNWEHNPIFNTNFYL